MTDFETEEPTFPEHEAPTEPELPSVAELATAAPHWQVEYEDQFGAPHQATIAAAPFATAGVLPFAFGTVEPVLPTAEAILKAAQRDSVPLTEENLRKPNGLPPITDARDLSMMQNPDGTALVTAIVPCVYLGYGPNGIELGPPPASEPTTRSLGVNAFGEVVPVAPNPSRGWLDWSVDSGSTQRRPKLRIKGLVEPASPKDLPPAPDETGWRERHRKLRTAMAEDDNRTIAKLMEPVLDELHTKEAPKPPVPPLDWSELEPAMVAELREWGKAHGVKPGSLGLMILVDESAAIRLVMADEVFEMRFDRRSVRAAWRDAQGRPRGAAAILVQRGSEELATAKARSVICVPDFTG